NLHTGDVLQAVEMLFAEGSGASEGNAHGVVPLMLGGSCGAARKLDSPRALRPTVSPYEGKRPTERPVANSLGSVLRRQAVTAHNTARLKRLTGCLFRLQQQGAERGVRSRDVVERVEILHLLTQRAAHDEPHHQLDAFRACFTQVLDMRHAA